VASCGIDKLPRKNQRPSDYSPAAIMLDLLLF
jgi:hypothetical protein